MSKYDQDLIIENIKILIRNSGLPQGKIAEELGMTQPNLSKALNKNEKRFFSVEQVYKIAEYFNVSIDSILGFSNEESQKTNLKTIALFIAKLLEEGSAALVKANVSEYVYLQKSFDPDALYTETEQRTDQYLALYFPNYWDPTKVKCDSHDERIALYDEARQCGNKTVYVHLNNFIKKFVDILKLYNDGQLSEEAYRIVVKDYINQLGDK